MPANLEAGDYKDRVQNEIYTSPPELQEALALLGEGRIVDASNQLNYCVQMNISTGNALCMMGFCLNHMGQDREAIDSCRLGRKRGISTLGLYYYFDAMVNALNNVDDLQGALAAVNEAIAHFKENNLPPSIADHLARKENILKQMASHLSKDESKQAMAKDCIIGAIQAICESLSISSEGWETDEPLQTDLDALRRIAGRVGVKSADLAFLSQMPNISSIVDKYFSSLSLAHSSTVENYNTAVDWFKQGNRLKASEFYQRAFDVCPEERSWDVAYKAKIAYAYGVNLLRMYDIENLRNLSNVGPETKIAIEKIRSLWSFTLRAYESLDSHTINEFDREFPPGLSEAVRNIGEDRIMHTVSGASEWKGLQWQKYPPNR